MKTDKLTVLIVEDQEINRELLKEILRREYTVLEAENGAVALDVLKTRDDVSAILLDIMMPVMDGFELLRQLRASAFASIPTIAITGDEDINIEQKTLDLGAWDFVSKPYRPMTLMTRLKNVIVRSQFYLLDKMKHIYEHDTLTGLYNRSHFFEVTRQLLDQNPGTKFAMVRFDIDHFQAYNSFWGEEEGDKLLKFLADQIREHASPSELSTYARINADVFCMCIPFCEENIRSFAKDQYDKLSSYNKEFRLFPSFGVYIIDNPAESIQNMYELATLAAQECKGNTLAYISFYKPEMSKKMLQDQWIVNEMQHALETRQFEVYLQPKYNLRTELPYGAEALVRWRHPEKGLLSPGLFVPVFEQNGFINKIDFYMWESVCALLRKWLDSGLRPGPISVNMSRMNMYNPNLVPTVTGLVQKYNIPPGLMHLEVTESAYMDNPKIIEETIKKLQQAGFVILMDDFGSGYSSLNTLKDIHVDVLKIDMKFLSGDSNNMRSRSILASMIRMAAWLNTPVIMEGVETKEQTEFLKSIGCNYVQGYYYGRPMPVSDYEKLTQGIKQVPTEPHSDNLKAVTDMLWAANPGSELLFDSLDDAAAVYQTEYGHVHILRANSSFRHHFAGNAIEKSLDEAVRHCLAPQSVETALKTFSEVAESHQPASCQLAMMEKGREKAVRMSLKFWGMNETAAIIFAEFKRMDREHPSGN